MALMPLAVLVESVEPRVRVGLEVRQLDSHPSCSCVALDKLLSLSVLSFFFCKMEIIVMFISYGYLEDQMSHSTYSSWFTENII